MPAMSSLHFLARPLEKPVRSAALAHGVHAQLRSDILLARLRPGQALSENQLALQLGVSRTPVREAIQALVREHLVVVQPQRGTQVAKLSMQRIREALFVREAVESHVIRSLLAKTNSLALSANRFVEIDACLARHVQALETGPLENILQADADFHRTLLMLCGMGGVWSVVAHARDMHQRVRAIALPELQSGHQALQDHTQIAHALRQGDAAQATALMAQHLQHNETLTQKIAELHPEYFDDEAGV